MTLEKLLEDFKVYKVDIEGKAESSVDLYQKHIREFLTDMNITTFEQLSETKAQVIKEWLVDLAERGNSAATRNNKLSAVKQIFIYLDNELDIVVDRKIDRIPIAKVIQKESNYISETQAEQLIMATTNQRTKAAISVTMKTGVRFKELMQLTCSDIDRGYATVLGKGNKERKIWFPPSTLKICRTFINDKRKYIVERTGVDTDLLFISDEGTPMTRQSFSTSLKNNAEKIGLYWSGHVSPHKLRHGFVTEALKDGVPINVVRDMAGHGNIATTNRYAHTDADQVMSAMLRETKEF